MQEYYILFMLGLMIVIPVIGFICMSLCLGIIIWIVDIFD